MILMVTVVACCGRRQQQPSRKEWNVSPFRKASFHLGSNIGNKLTWVVRLSKGCHQQCRTALSLTPFPPHFLSYPETRKKSTRQKNQRTVAHTSTVQPPFSSLRSLRVACRMDKTHSFSNRCPPRLSETPTRNSEKPKIRHPSSSPPPPPQRQEKHTLTGTVSL